MDIRTAIKNRKRGAIIKHSHMFDIYESHFASFDKTQELKILEIGVYNGGSLYMWKEYFPNATIIGMDIDPYCERWASPVDDIKIYLGDQSDRNFLQNIVEQEGPFDIIIDDGGHENHQIIISFEELFPAVVNGGLYVVEDTFCSYWPEQSCDREYSTVVTEPDGTTSGGIALNPIQKEFDKNNTCMEFLKSLTDKLHVWAYKKGGEGYNEAGVFQDDSEPDFFDKNLFSIHFYDSMCIVQKAERDGIKSFGVSEWMPEQ